MKKYVCVVALMLLTQITFVCGMLQQKLKKVKRKEKHLQKEKQKIAREQKKRLILEKLISLNVRDDIVPEVFVIAKKERPENITDDFLRKIIDKKRQEKRKERKKSVKRK